jgi:exosortase E/protease (VPEID-CTERM system)
MSLDASGLDAATCPRSAGFQSAQPLPLVRWACLAALLLTEVMLLTLRFDTASLRHETGWWAELLGQAHLVPRLAIAIGAAVLVFGGRGLREELEELSPRLAGALSVWPLFLAHLIAFAGFAWLTALVLEGDIGASAYPLAWVIAWILLGLATFALWAATLLPANLWLPLARRAAVPLLTGVVVGIAGLGFGFLTDLLWEPLGHMTLRVVQVLLQLASTDVICQPGEMIVGTSVFAVHIAPECSGYQGIGLVWVFVGAYLWLYRRSLRFPHAWLLFPIGTVIIWLANAVRIAALIALGTWGSSAVALGGFHSQAGSLFFTAIALGLVVMTQRLPFFAVNLETVKPGYATPAYLAPMLAIMATTMITGAFSSGFDSFYPLRVVVAAGVCWLFRSHYAGWKFSWSWSAVTIGIGVFAVWMALEPMAPSSTTETELAAGLAQLTGGQALIWLFFRIVGSVLTVPFAEELAFRGYLTRRLLAADFEQAPMGKFSWFSFLASSVCFGALHGRWLAGTLAGMAFALALYRRGRLSDCVLAHATANALIAAYVLFGGAWSLWS